MVSTTPINVSQSTDTDTPALQDFLDPATLLQPKQQPSSSGPQQDDVCSLKELLQIVWELLSQHEVRLCLVLLEEFCQYQPLAELPLDTDGLTMWQVVGGALESQLQQGGTKDLRHLLYRCKNNGKTKEDKRKSKRASQAPGKSRGSVLNEGPTTEEFSHPHSLTSSGSHPMDWNPFTDSSGENPQTHVSSGGKIPLPAQPTSGKRSILKPKGSTSTSAALKSAKPQLGPQAANPQAPNATSADGCGTSIDPAPNASPAYTISTPNSALPPKVNSAPMPVGSSPSVMSTPSGTAFGPMGPMPSDISAATSSQLPARVSSVTWSAEVQSLQPPSKTPSNNPGGQPQQIKEEESDEYSSSDDEDYGRGGGKSSFQLSRAYSSVAHNHENAGTRKSVAAPRPSAKMSLAGGGAPDVSAVLEGGDFGGAGTETEEGLSRLATSSGWYIIHPNSAKKLKWDLLGTLFIFIEAFLVPLSLGFDIEPAPWYFWCSTCYFGCDICSQFITGFYKEGWLVMQQSLIIKHYVTGFFPLDFVATVPWDVVLGGGGGGGGSQVARIARLGKLLRLTRLVRILKLGALIERIEDLMPGGSAALVFSLVKMLVMFCVVCHWIACTWGFLGAPKNTATELQELPPHQLEDCEMGGVCEYGLVGSPWQRRSGLDNYGADDRYLVSLHFATGLLTGGDSGMQPGHAIERVFVNIIMVLSFLLASMVLSQIVVIMEQMSASKAELTHRLRCAKSFMAVKKVPVVLQAKVRRYLIYQSKMSHEAQLQNREFMEHLSQWIRLELMEHMNGETIYLHPFFQELPRAVLQRISGVTKTILCAPGDIVVQRGHRGKSMCWLVRGKLKIVQPSNPSHKDKTHGEYEDVMHAPSWIGDECLFRDTRRNCTAISMAHSELLTLEKQCMYELLEDFPKSLKCYGEWAERMKEEGGVKCEQCNKLGHTDEICPQNKADLEPTHSQRASQKGITGKLRRCFHCTPCGKSSARHNRGSTFSDVHTDK